MPALVAAMLREYESKKYLLDELPLESVYFGGGTPGMLPPELLRNLFEAIQDKLNPNQEITLEVNPEDITTESLAVWKNLGVNRLSIGIQSLSETDLQYMNRNHTAAQAVAAVKAALEGGIRSVNIDLIFGSPWLDNVSWRKTLEWAFHCGADHISAYALTVEARTFLNRMIQEGKWPEISEQRQEAQYMQLIEFAEKAGWDFYEISNLCKPGHRAVHNSNYWRNQPYLGIGPSAHSFFGNTRWWNVSDNKKYIEGISAGTDVHESETLSKADEMNEYLLTNLRTVEGVDVNLLRGKIDQSTVEKWIGSAHLAHRNGRMVLTSKGRLLADKITAELMLE